MSAALLRDFNVATGARASRSYDSEYCSLCSIAIRRDRLRHLTVAIVMSVINTINMLMIASLTPVACFIRNVGVFNRPYTPRMMCKVRLRSLRSIDIIIIITIVVPTVLVWHAGGITSTIRMNLYLNPMAYEHEYGPE